MPAKHHRSRKADSYDLHHADVLRFWHVCESAACRSARACRGDARTCARRNFKRLPDDVQSWYACLLMGKEEGLPFEETMARIAETRVANAYENWIAEVDGRAPAPAPTPAPAPAPRPVKAVRRASY
jgi:hypothetical protein